MARPSKTALFEAAKRWDVATVKALLAAAPALVMATDPKGRTALHVACAVSPGRQDLGEPHGVNTAEVLLDAGAPLEAAVPMDEAEGDFRATPLWYAVSRGCNLPLVRALLQHGADPSYSLWAVVWRDDADMCRELLAAKPRLNLVADGETPILRGASAAAENPRSSHRGRRRSVDRGPARARRGRDCVRAAPAEAHNRAPQ
ncbi:MAG TPA: hypothetical protein VHN20_10350 [Beijerinckiaceae bacterium]|nr:hypothetical protein [Beijerinckiaceae bacterium]